MGNSLDSGQHQQFNSVQQEPAIRRSQINEVGGESPKRKGRENDESTDRDSKFSKPDCDASPRKRTDDTEDMMVTDSSPLESSIVYGRYKLRPTEMFSIHHEGTLLKQREVMKFWPSRYFVLHSKTLSYYKDMKRSNNNKRLKGSIVINEHTMTVTSDEKFQQEDVYFYPFTIIQSDLNVTYNLAASSKEERETWIRYIRETAQQACIEKEFKK